jgi:hypothetical protein
LLIAGCYPTKKVCEEAAQVAPSVVIGTGSTHFELFEEGAELAPVNGVQGGSHIWGAVSVTGLNPGKGEMKFKNWRLEAKGKDPVMLRFSIDFEDESIESSRMSNLAFLSGDVLSAEVFGQTVFIGAYDLQQAYPEVEGLSATMSVEVEDACGTVVSDSRAMWVDLTDSF